MEIKNPIFEDLEFEQIYHLFTRVSGNELIFRNDENYRYFLEKVTRYLLPYAEIYAYCLVPQKLSLLLNFRSKKTIFKNLELDDRILSKSEEHKFLMQPLSNLLNSYAKSYNKVYQRKGALFVDFIKREKLNDEDRLKNVFKELHTSPIQSNVVSNLVDWKYSSFRSYLEKGKPSKIQREFMLSFFKDNNDFIEFHKL